MLKKVFFATLLGSSLVLGACGNTDKSDKKDEPEPEKEVVQEDAESSNNNVVDKSETTKSDEDLGELFNKEEGVSNTRIIITEDAGGFVLVDFDVSDEMEEKQAEKVMDNYIKSIEEKYADYSIDIQARKGGETFARKTIEK